MNESEWTREHLDLPAGPIRRHEAGALVPFDRMRDRIRQLRAWFPASLPTPEERWKAKVQVEFRIME